MKVEVRTEPNKSPLIGYVNGVGNFQPIGRADELMELKAQLAETEDVLKASLDKSNELQTRLVALRPYLKHTRDCPQPTDINLDAIGIDTSCTCGLAEIKGEK